MCDTYVSSLEGFVNWSLSEFKVGQLVDGEAFPAYSALDLNLRNADGDRVRTGSTNYIYMPFVDYDCLRTNAPDIQLPEVVTLMNNQT